MRFTLSKRVLLPFKNMLLSAVVLTFLSCQQGEETSDTTETEAITDAVLETDTVAARPAPTFFVIPPDLAEKRVWICEGSTSDLFHVQHDCPVLLECKGQGSFRNLTLVRAIESYGRYNCEICSDELNHIFDEDMVR